MGVLTVAVAGPVLVIDTSAVGGLLTVVVADAVLLTVFGSDSVAPTVALLMMVPVCVGVAGMVTTALAWLAREPTLQVTVPEALEQPGVAELKVTPDGRV